MELTRESVLKLLKNIIEAETFDHNQIKEFQNVIFNAEGISVESEIEELIRDLAYDLDYYEPNESARRESPSFFGKERAIEIINNTVKKIESM